MPDERLRRRTDAPRPTKAPTAGTERPAGLAGSMTAQTLAMQRSAGNQAVNQVLAGPRRAPDPWAKRPEQKPGFFARGGLAIKAFFTTTFGSDPSKITPDTPEVSDETRREMHQILGAAIAERDRRKKELMERHFIAEDTAELQANQEAFKDIPESWRPRVVTVAEWQIKRNTAALQTERVQKLVASEGKADPTTSVGKAVLKKDRDHAFKASLIGKPPDEVNRLKEQHGRHLEEREKAKASLKAGYAERDEAVLKAFEKRLKAMPAEQRAAAQRVFDQKKVELDAQRRLQRYRERMNGLPAEEIASRMRIFARQNGLEAALDLTGHGAAITGLGIGKGVLDAASGLSAGSGGIAQLSGDTAVGGTTEQIDGRSIQSQVGTATVGGDVAGSAGALINAGATVTQLIRGYDGLSRGDGAQKVRADDDIVDGILGVGQDAVTLGGQGVSLAKDLGGGAVDGVGLQAMGIPGFDVAANFFNVVRSGRRVVDNAQRAHTAGKLAAAAHKLKDDVLGRVIGHVRDRGIHLATHYSVDALAASLKTAGDIGILTGVGAAAGGAIKIAGSVVGGVNLAARQVADSHRAGKALEARGQARLALPGSAENLLTFDALQVAQTIVDRARQGDPLYLRALSTFGLDAAGLKASSDANVRTLILTRLESSEDPKTLTKTATNLLSSIKGGLRSFGAGIRDVWLKPKEISELRQLKNELGYGGRSDRGTMWSVQQFFSPGSATAQKAHMRQLVERADLEPANKTKLLALSLNHEQKQERSDAGSGPTDISAPIIAYESMSASQLESVLASADLSAEEHARVAITWLEKRQEETVPA